MSEPTKLTPEEASEVLGALESPPGTPLPPMWKARIEAALKAAEEHAKSAAKDCPCLQCAIDRGEVSL